MRWSVAKALAAVAYDEHFDFALLLILGFAFYLRTMELIGLRSADIHLDQRTPSLRPPCK